MNRSYPINRLFPSNEEDVKMMPLISYMTNIMRIFGYKIFYRKLKTNSLSIRLGNVQWRI